MQVDPGDRPAGCAALRQLLFPDEPTDEGRSFHIDEGSLPADLLPGDRPLTPHLGEGDTLGRGRYALQRRLSEGQWSTVWKALDTRAERDVALKVLHDRWGDSDEIVDRFFHGATLMQAVDHPGVPEVIEAEGREGSHCYYVMEYVDGGSLLSRRLDGSVDSSGAVTAVLQAGEALAAVHAQELLHRDVEPRNIVLDHHDRAFLVDFGGMSGYRTRAAASLPAVAWPFVAPEVHDDQGRASQSTDLYGLAMCLVFALHGQPLPAEAVRDPEAFIDTLACTDACKHLLAAALARDPQDRPGSVAGFVSDFRQACSDRSGRRPYVPSDERVRRRLQRRARLYGGFGLFTLLAVVAGGLVLRNLADAYDRSREERRVEHLTAQGWRRAGAHPGQALAFLRAAIAGQEALGLSTDLILSREEAVRLGSQGARQLVRPMRHNVLVLETSPDGQTLAAGLEDGSVVLLDAVTGQQRAVAEEVADRVYHLAWSPDSTLVAAWDQRSAARGESNRAAAFIDAATGSVRYTVAHTRSVSQVRFSPTGRWVATNGRDGTSLWDAVTGVFQRRLGDETHRGAVTWLDEERAILSNPPSVWDIDGNALLAKLPAEEYGAGGYWVRLSPDGRTLSSVDSTGIRTWDLVTGQPGPHVPTSTVRWLRISPEGTRLASWSRGNTIGLWSLPDLTPVATLAGHTSRPMEVVFGPRNQVLSASLDGTARLWRERDGSPLGVLRGHTAGLHDATWIGPVPVTGGLDATTRWWPRAQDQPLRLQGPLAEPSGLAWSADGSRLALGSRDGAVWVADLIEGDTVLEASLNERVLSLALPPAGGGVSVGLADETIVELDSRGSLVGTWTAPPNPHPANGEFRAHRISHLDDGRRLAWNKVTVHLEGSDYVPTSLLPEPWAVAVVGELVVESSILDARIAALDPRTGEIPWQLALPFSQPAARAEPSGDGASLAVPGFGGEIAVVDTDTGTLKASAHLHDGGTSSVRWVGQDQGLLSSGADGRVLLLDPTDLSIQSELWSGDRALEAAEPSPDGRCVALLGADGFLRMMDLDTQRLGAVYDLGEVGLYGAHWIEPTGRFALVTADAEVLIFEGDCVPRDDDLLTETGAWTNLRLCPDDRTVVPVVPFPSPDTVYAPTQACPPAPD